MQADADFDYDNLLSYVTKPYEQNGEQRIFPLFDSLYMTYARKDEIGGVMTPEEYLAYADGVISEGNQRLPDTRYVFRGVLGERYDMTVGTCNFDDPDLAAWIDTSASLGSGPEITEDISEKEQFRQGKRSTYSQYLQTSSSLYSYVTMMYDLGAQSPDDIIPVGYPNEDRQLTADSIGGYYFAVTAASPYKAECIDLLQVHMSEQLDGYQAIDNIRNTYYASDIDIQLSWFEGLTVVQENRVISVVTDEEAENMTGVKVKIIREWADAYIAMLDSITRRTTDYRVPEQIFYEELRSQTGKTTEEILAAVQSRVSIYLFEQAQ